jgi:monoamine oxidase
VVVGAGLAGLTAAYELDRSGFEVLVLEARRRVGGRIRTVRLGQQHAEAGGEYIDMGHREVRRYARRFGLALEDVRKGPDLDAVIYRGGRRRVADRVETYAVSRRIDRFWSRVEALAEPLDPSWPQRQGARLDRRSAGDLIAELGIDGTARFLLERDLLDDYTVEPDRLSLLFVCSLERLAAGQPDSGLEAFRIRGGNARLPRAFARSLRVELGQRVSSLEWSTSGVRVTVGVRTVEADHCVLALPLPALRPIEFQPALPDILRAAVEELQYGAATKTLLRYRRRVWRSAGLSGDALTDLSAGTVWEASDRQPGREGVLISYAAGARKPPLPEAAAADLDAVFPGSIKAHDRGVRADWATDPLTGGSYTAYAPGQVTRFWDAVRTPFGRVTLAGEHADAYTGYMEGAIRSGRRAAARIGG